MPHAASAECPSASSGHVPLTRASRSSRTANGFSTALATAPSVRASAAAECPMAPPMSGTFTGGVAMSSAVAEGDEDEGQGTPSRACETSALCA